MVIILCVLVELCFRVGTTAGILAMNLTFQGLTPVSSRQQISTLSVKAEFGCVSRITTSQEVTSRSFIKNKALVDTPRLLAFY